MKNVEGPFLNKRAFHFKMSNSVTQNGNIVQGII